MMTIVGAMLVSIFRLSIPILLMALGNLYCERSGVQNLGAEGMMIAGAFCAALGSFYSGNAWVGVLAGMLGGMLISTIHSINSVEFGGVQNISGLGLNTLAAGLASFLCRQLFGSGITPSVSHLQRTELFAKIPYVGNFLAQFSPLAYICILLVLFSYYLLNKTVLGVRIIAVGDDPIAAETAGVNVWNIRHLCVSVFCGICAGLAGTYLALGQLSFYQDNITTGKGMLAIIAVKMGRWEIKRMTLVAFLFGFFDALQVQIQLRVSTISPELIQIIPFVAGIAVLAMSKEDAASPQAMTVPYLKNRYRI